ncbi:MAG: PucR family transcriptional regulator [Zhaonellaceae bacterium]|jgi:sugar diacid utilization regulator
MFKTIALKLLEELGPPIKMPVQIRDIYEEIVASANCKDQLTLEDGENQGFWQKRDLYHNYQKIGSIWLYGQTEEARIYLNLLVAVFQQNYRKKKNSKVQLEEDGLRLLLTTQCELQAIPNLLAQAGLKLGRSQYVFVIETKGTEAGQVDNMLKKVWRKQNAYSAKITENTLAFVVENQLIEETADDFALMLHQLILDELYLECRIGFSTPADAPQMLSEKFKEAMEALKLTKYFGLLHHVINYSKISLLKLLKSIPESTLKKISTSFGHEWQLLAGDRELLLTLQKYIDFNLNVSEAARSLFVHRNTLLYRLGKVQKLTGLDYRNFDDMVFLRLMMLINAKE